jgi:hypothetical protein
LFCGAKKIDLICFESPVATFAEYQHPPIKLLTAFASTFEYWALEPIEPARLRWRARSHFIGRNLRSAIAKPLTLARCRERGWMCETHDEADALACSTTRSRA